MLRSSVQMYGETVTPVEVQDICELLNHNKLRLLSLRDCVVLDPCFEKLMEGVGNCKSILHLNLNLGMMTSCSRAWMLANALTSNRSLISLFVHGSSVGERGMCMILEAVNTHPGIISLDLGDCLLKDQALFLASTLLAPRGAKKGLQDLSLSGNCDISSFAWCKFFLDLSACNNLRSLSLDYNKIGDYGVGYLACALVHCRHLQTVDLEGCGINEYGAEILLHVMRNYYPVSLKQLTLSGNSISRNTIEKINAYLETDDKESSCDSGSIKVIKEPCCEFEKRSSGGPSLTVTDGSTITSVNLFEPEKRRKRGHHKRK